MWGGGEGVGAVGSITNFMSFYSYTINGSVLKLNVSVKISSFYHLYDTIKLDTRPDISEIQLREPQNKL